MNERSFDRFTEDEAEEAAGGSVPHVVAWLKAEGISAGSTADYNLYRAIQDAIMDEWRRAKALIPHVEANSLEPHAEPHESANL